MTSRFIHFIYVTAIIVLLSLLPIRGVLAENAPDYIRAEISEAQLQGNGLLSWFGFKIYYANLWVSKKNSSPQTILNQPFALELHYQRKLEGTQIAKASFDEIKRLKIGTEAQQAVWLRSMQTIFPNVEKGTYLTGIHLPDQATRFYRDGKLLGEISDPLFGAAFFSIWLDIKTREPTLRNALLGTK